MVKEVHKIVRESEGRRIIIANSATSIDETNKDDIVVDGSHFGLNVGEMAKKAGVIGMIGNGTSTYEEGKISVANEVAKRLGITAGMSAKEAADRMFIAVSKPDM